MGFKGLMKAPIKRLLVLRAQSPRPVLFARAYVRLGFNNWGNRRGFASAPVFVWDNINNTMVSTGRMPIYENDFYIGLCKIISATDQKGLR